MEIMTPILPEGVKATLPKRFACPVCDKKTTTKGFVNHLNRCLEKHDLTKDEYEKLHQTTLYSPAHQFAVKWFQLAEFDVYRFGLMDYVGRTWCHIDAGNPKPWYYKPWRKPETCPLLRFEDGKTNLRKSFWHFKKHLDGDLTLGIWPAMTNRFTMIDLDDEDVAYRDSLAERLTDLQLFFYLVFSGKKGYQFWIFWDKDLPHKQLLELQSFLCKDIPHDTNVWPYKKSLIKLPLGLHRETQHLVCFVDVHGVPFDLDEQLNYFLDIKDNRVPKLAFSANACPGFSAPNSSRKKTVANEKNIRGSHEICSSDQRVKQRDVAALERCLRNGTKLQEGRHLTLFFLSLHLKENSKFTITEAQQRLEKWSTQVDSKHDLKERLRDAHATLNRVYERDMVFSGVSMSTLTEEETAVVKEVCEVYISVYGPFGSTTRKEDRTKLTNSTQKVARVLASMAKGHDGPFTVGHRMLAELSGLSRTTIGRALAILVEDPVLEMQFDPEDYDPVIWNYDKRPRRHGGMFTCERRGSFPAYRKSIYRLKDELVEKLGWTKRRESAAGQLQQ